MATKPVTLLVKPRGKRIPTLPKETTTYIQGSTSDLYHRIAAESRFSIHRLRVTKEDGTFIPNDKKTSIDSQGLKDQSVILVKDLGPQISWQTVFLVEYLGPILIHPLLYFARPYIYKDAPAQPSTLQTISCAIIVLHFIKRELETLFVHRFSNATMPAFNIFRNSAHYWALSGLLTAYFTYSPTSITAGPSEPAALLYAGLALFVIGELCNLNTHLILRSLRSPGGTERGVPRGLGFSWVTCPNYFFESLAWLGIVMVNKSWSTAVFAVVATGQMMLWARKKERRYRKELGSGYKKKRFSMIPGLW